jgi:hypothetical protein
MGNGSGVSGGDRNRNARLERLRVLVPVTNAIAGIDLAGSKQMVVVTDHDSKVIARRTFRCRAWDLGLALDWAAGRAAASGWTGEREAPACRLPRPVFLQIRAVEVGFEPTEGLPLARFRGLRTTLHHRPPASLTSAGSRPVSAGERPGRE